MSKYKYFSLKELKCKCCGALDMSYFLMYRLEKARKLAGVPFVITSGYRCENHNEHIGGSKTSSHLRGLAVDIGAVGSERRFHILSSLIDVGFTRIGIGRDFIHVDVDRTKAQEVAWVYFK